MVLLGFVLFFILILLSYYACSFYLSGFQFLCINYSFYSFNHSSFAFLYLFNFLIVLPIPYLFFILSLSSLLLLFMTIYCCFKVLPCQCPHFPLMDGICFLIWFHFLWFFCFCHHLSVILFFFNFFEPSRVLWVCFQSLVCVISDHLHNLHLP